jgi:hypothetical protein
MSNRGISSFSKDEIQNPAILVQQLQASVAR